MLRDAAKEIRRPCVDALRLFVLSFLREAPTPPPFALLFFHAFACWFYARRRAYVMRVFFFPILNTMLLMPATLSSFIRFSAHFFPTLRPSPCHVDTRLSHTLYCLLIGFHCRLYADIRCRVIDDFVFATSIHVD